LRDRLVDAAGVRLNCGALQMSQACAVDAASASNTAVVDTNLVMEIS
jgi:hypothetical protein